MRNVVIRFDGLIAESEDLSEPWQLLLRVDSRIGIDVDAKPVYEEDLFPVVEFAVQAKRWADQATDSGLEFTYRSMDSDEPALLWFKRVPDGWSIVSAWRLIFVCLIVCDDLRSARLLRPTSRRGAARLPQRHRRTSKLGPLVTP